MRLTLSTLAALLLVTSLVACGGGDDDPDTAPSATSSTGGDGGTATAAPAGDEFPLGADADFPVAIPDGWVIDVFGRAGLEQPNQVSVLYPLDQYDAIVAFYDQWTTDQPDEYIRSETADTVGYILEGTVQRIAVDRGYEERDQGYVSVGILVASN